jgi:uncharacterized protein (DUF1778 family)
MPRAAVKRPATPEAKGKTSINLRMSKQMRTLIDAAAAILGKSRTEFMLESARQHAIDVLLDQRLFALDAEHYAAFERALADPPPPNAKLKQLLASKSPWET